MVGYIPNEAIQSNTGSCYDHYRMLPLEVTLRILERYCKIASDRLAVGRHGEDEAESQDGCSDDA